MPVAAKIALQNAAINGGTSGSQLPQEGLHSPTGYHQNVGSNVLFISTIALYTPPQLAQITD